MSDKVKVAVRVRPMNRREIDLGTKCVVDMEDNQTVLHHPDSKESSQEDGLRTPKTFAFDNCFWSLEAKNSKFADQSLVYNELGTDILDQAFKGYNACILAYGQTGSGKSYTMMGTCDQKGIIPRLCDALFDHITKIESSLHSCKVEVAYMEIYNEKVLDLLDPKGGKQYLKVREHNILGPYVDGLTTLLVSSFEDIEQVMSEGNKSRTVAATNMNSESSRSHAVFTITLTQSLTDERSGVTGEKVSKLSLVDLAGSERAQKSGAIGERLKEGSNINKSLTTLGLVISALADRSSGKSKVKFVPYRDSVLTWLLKDNLGGNSKTIMIATISPAADNYGETLSTLRYADRAKRIVNHAVINEDPKARIIRELREELEALRKELSIAQSKAPDVQERLQESEKLMKDITKTWDEKLAETDKIQQERHAALERMGISVEQSGIKVTQGKYFLVNLNADPSLNELLVYYLKDHTLVGRPDSSVEQDIQLSGLGIMAEHCVIDIQDNECSVTPLPDARTCVNGSVIKDVTKVKNGDRILWGTNHFFRINCPRNSNVVNAEPEVNIDYDFAQKELMLKEFDNDPINDAIKRIERQHQEEKREALDKQRLEYENKMRDLKYQLMSPSTPSRPFVPLDSLHRNLPLTPSIHKDTQLWAQERERLFLRSLAKLRGDVMKAQALVREANFLAIEMGRDMEFSVTLQIPAANLTPGRRSGSFVTEPAILVRQGGKTKQVCSMEMFENKMIDMRDTYEERKDKGLPLSEDASSYKDQIPDPFYESQENHSLIGVANLFLSCLFHDIKLEYKIPIISQQGDLAGKLHVEIWKIGGRVYDPLTCNGHMNESAADEFTCKPMIVTFTIKEAHGLPQGLTNFVFCQYNFWNYSETFTVSADVTDKPRLDNSGSPILTFDHRKEFMVYMTEEFIEHITEGALSIEVWGHRSPGFNQGHLNHVSDNVQTRSRSLVDRWTEVMRKIELWVEISEINDQGDFAPVEVIPRLEVCTGGIYQLRQGRARRIKVGVRPLVKSGQLPVNLETIIGIEVGGICSRSKFQKGLDSYQEHDLMLLREHWSDALDRRKQYLDDQIQRLMKKSNKNESDQERERALLQQWVLLCEERNDVMVPAADSRVPGAPADWDPPLGMEQHIPVLYLNLNADDMSTSTLVDIYQMAGDSCLLTKEDSLSFVSLPIIKCHKVIAVASWDTSMHDSPQLNRATPTNERIYVILKVTIRLSHPAAMEIVLRKRICLNIYKKQILSSMTDFMKQIIKLEMLNATGITYEMVSHIPKASEALEDKETLAQLAVSHHDDNANDGETYIEKYIKGEVSSVESILTLDRLRQEVAVKELLASSGKGLRKTASVPNMTNMCSAFLKLENQMKSDSSENISQEATFSTRSSSFTARPNFLNIGVASWALKSAITPHSSRVQMPLRTLMEEHHHFEQRSPTFNQRVDKQSYLPTSQSSGSDEFHDSEFSGPRTSTCDSQSFQPQIGRIVHSSTNESLADLQTKSYTPSLVSSGYGSQTMSSLLTSEDSFSLGTDDSDAKECVQKLAPPQEANPEFFSIHNYDFVSHDRNFTENPLSDNANDSSVSCDPFASSSFETSNINLSVSDGADVGPRQDHNHPEIVTHDDTGRYYIESDSKVNSILHISDDDLDTANTINHDIPIEKFVSDKIDHRKTSGDRLKMLTSLLEKRNRISSDDPPSQRLKSLTPTSDNPVPDTRQSANRSVDSFELTDPYSITALEELEKFDSFNSTNEYDNTDLSDASYPNITEGEFSELLVKRSLSEKHPRPKSSIFPTSSSAYNITSDRPLSTDVMTDDSLSDSMSLCSFGSRADLDRIHEGPIPTWINIGESALVTSSNTPVKKTGVIRYIGSLSFASGNWVGVELDLPEGKNDGMVSGTRYFQCRPKHGIFVRPTKLIRDKRRRAVSKVNAEYPDTVPVSHVRHGTKPLLSSSAIRASVNKKKPQS